jgi:hypothetical protein
MAGPDVLKQRDKREHTFRKRVLTAALRRGGSGVVC